MSNDFYIERFYISTYNFIQDTNAYDTPEIFSILSTAKCLLNACFTGPWIEGIIHVHAM